jgi:solute carrier family 66 (lysosomal lysine-arginine transporter), member 1
VPTVVAIAVYFCVADGVLIGQCGWYWYFNSGVFDGDGGDGDAVKKGNKMGGRRTSGSGGGSQVVDGMGGEEEEEPLLARQRSGSITIPGSGERRRRRSSRARSSVGAGAGAAAAAAARRRGSQADHLWAGIVEEERGNRAGARGKASMKNLLSLLAIVAVGTAGWAIAWGSGAWRPTPVLDGADSGGETGPLGAQLLGYASALAYLGARIPQIVKNARDKSCEGTYTVLHSHPLPFSLTVCLCFSRFLLLFFLERLKPIISLN